MGEHLCPAVSSTCTCGVAVQRITVSVKPTTGGVFTVTIAHDESVDKLIVVVAQKFKVPRDRICLLFKNRMLRGGTLEANNVQHGSQLILLPSVETGLVSPRPDQSVIQALEGLSSSQVNEFLSGKSPLNLTVRLGDHMMLIQLQLSPTQSAAAQNSRQHNATPDHGAVSNQTGASASSHMRVANSSARCRHQQRRLSPTPSSPSTAVPPPCLDTRALSDASRNLMRTLKQLSSEVLSASAPASCSRASTLHQPPSSTLPPCGALDEAECSASSRQNECCSRRNTRASHCTTITDAAAARSGAIIESMQHHGKGVYSGTFSGTLNPALQDALGRPRRDIATIVHILNDLLSANPHCPLPATCLGGAPEAVVSGAGGRVSVSAQQHEHAGKQTVVTADHAGARGECVSAPHSASAAVFCGDDDVTQRVATRDKMQRLRSIMQQRRLRRQQRRSACSAPYVTNWSAKSMKTLSSGAISSAAQATTSTAETTATIDGALLGESCGTSTETSSEAEVAPSAALVACGGQHSL